MKRILSFILTVLMLMSLPGALPATAEEAWICAVCGEENVGDVCEACGTPRSEAMPYQYGLALEWALTASLRIKALTINGDWYEGWKAYADRFAAIDAAHPDCGVLIDLDMEALSMLEGSLGMCGYDWCESLSERFNAPQGEECLEFAMLSSVGSFSAIFPEGCLMVVLVYGQEIILTWHTMEGSMYSLCLPGAAAGGFGEETARQVLSEYGVEGARIVMYPTGDALAGGRNEHLLPAEACEEEMLLEIVKSQQSVEALMPGLYGCGLYTPDSVAPAVFSRYLQANSATATEGLEAVRFVHEQLYPILRDQGLEDDEWTDDIYGVDLADIAGSWSSPVALEAGSIDAPSGSSPLKPGDKVLVVYRKNAVSGQVTTLHQAFLQACMDESWRPDSPDQADYILLIDTSWEESDSRADITFYDATSVVTLNDAKTGAVVMNIATRRDSPYGMVTVYGNSYYQPPRMDSLWNDEIKGALFE